MKYTTSDDPTTEKFWAEMSQLVDSMPGVFGLPHKTVIDVKYSEDNENHEFVFIQHGDKKIMAVF